VISGGGGITSYCMIMIGRVNNCQLTFIEVDQSGPSHAGSVRSSVALTPGQGYSHLPATLKLEGQSLSTDSFRTFKKKYFF